MKDQLVKLIPEFDLIKNPGLKEKILNVWIKALNIRKMQPEDMLRMPFTLLIKPCPVNFVEHTRGVVQVSYAAAQAVQNIYGDKIPLNMDYLLAGALLHDVGKILEYIERDGEFVKSNEGKFLRHPFSGVGLAFDEGIPDEVMHMIAVHAGEGDGKWRSNEAIIIHHADFTNFEPLHGK
ncbi:MAG: HD domain-containing protein [Calditrichaeota bacterium]|nr:HD domain-containing protein [Calditrichota bacterium]RQW03914.1 MAG: HD domain-containing protein [Calditrichota bacterium]